MSRHKPYSRWKCQVALGFPLGVHPWLSNGQGPRAKLWNPIQLLKWSRIRFPSQRGLDWRLSITNKSRGAAHFDTHTQKSSPSGCRVKRSPSSCQFRTTRRSSLVLFFLDFFFLLKIPAPSVSIFHRRQDIRATARETICAAVDFCRRRVVSRVRPRMWNWKTRNNASNASISIESS